MTLTYNLKICLVTILIVLILKPLFMKVRNMLILRKIPSPNSSSILGFTKEFLQLSPEELFTRFRFYARQYKGIFRLSFLQIDIINIYNPEDIEQIISGYKHHSKSRTYQFLESWLGTGLLTSTGSKWYHRRKLLTPAFHFQILQQYLISFNEGTKRFIRKIEENLGECDDIKPVILNFTLNTICDTAMGLEKNQQTSFKTYRENVENFGLIVVEKIVTPWYRSDFLYNFFELAKKEKRTVEKLHGFSDAVIKNREKDNDKMADNVGKRKLAMLDILLKSKREGADIDYEGIREEVDTFMFEGHDTVSSAINSILLVFANHADIQEKAAREVNDLFHGSDRDCTVDDLTKLQYLECCIKETLRLYPSVPFISRVSGEDFTTSTGYFVPEGTVLHIHVFDLHRNPEVFPDPETFKPERFLDDNDNNVKRHAYSYIPFSAGPRNCIGQKFAMWEMKTLLVGLLRKFKMEPVTAIRDVEFKSDLVLTMTNPIKIKFSIR